MVIAKTNTDRRVRLAIIVLMFFGMGGWFAYDGWVKYPGENFKWAMENFPVKPESAETNPRVTTATAANIEAGMPVGDVIDRLGEPAIRLPREMQFFGEDLTIIVHVEEDVIRDVSSRRREGAERLTAANPRVRESMLAELEEGMSVESLKRRLGEPDLHDPPTLWYVGPAVFLKVPVTEGTVAEGVEFHENDERTESDIQLQKIIGIGLFAIGLWFLIKTGREYTLRIVADDSGLRLAGQHVTWDDVTGLDTSIYEDKGWLDLKYRKGGSERTYRLDSYYLTNFDSLMEEIARNKGWAWPQGAGAEPAGGAFPVETQEDEASSMSEPEQRSTDQA